MKPFNCWIAITCLLSGCAGSQDQASHQIGVSLNASNSSVVCVVTPQNKEYEGYLYEQSGSIVAKITADALREKFSNIIIVNNVQECEIKNAKYSVVPDIIHWEDRVTGWTGRPDIVKIHIKAVDLNFKDNVTEVRFENSSNLVASAITEWGNRSPEILLDDGYKKAVLMLLTPSK